MANNLLTKKTITTVAALAEGASIRGIERMTGVNRNTIVSLGLRIRADCAKIMDTKMRDLVHQNPTTQHLNTIWMQESNNNPKST